MSRTPSGPTKARRMGSVSDEREVLTSGRRRDAEVLEAAIKVFYRQSYADSSVQDVADELGILKGSLYYYIRTKEDLLVRLMEDVHDDVERILVDVTGREDLTPLQRLELYVREQVLYNTRNLARISVYHHDAAQLSEAPLKLLHERRREHVRAVATMIRDAQERGEVARELDPRTLSHLVFSIVNGMSRWYRPDGRTGPDEVADVCARFTLAGVTGTGAPFPGMALAVTDPVSAPCPATVVVV